VVLAALSVFAMVVLSARQQENAPTFRSSVQLIEVDAVVTDAQGKPVKDLKAEDFEILEDNRSQQIRTFSLVDLPTVRDADPAGPRSNAVEPDVTTNAGAEGRTYVLLLDTGPVGEVVLRARHLAERWLDEVVKTTDRVAVIHVQGNFTDAQPFTSSRRLILNAINKTLGSGSAAAGVLGLVQRNLDAWRVIKDVSERLGTISSRRKAIVWFVYPAPILYASSYLQSCGGGGASCRGLENAIANSESHLLAAWHEAAQAAVNNNVAIYPVDPQGLTTDLGTITEQASLREVAEETGGVAVGVNTNNFSDGFSTIAQDLGTYYLLGYTPDLERIEGRFHPIEVRVKRAGVTVRARRGYYASSANAAPPKALPAPPEGVSLAARDALRRPVATKGLGIDVSTVSFRHNRKDTDVVITAHIRGQTLEFDAGRRLAISYQVFDSEGKVVTGFYKVFGFNLGSESLVRATGTGLQFVERITLKPGRYELRLVAEQPGGPLGSVNATIDAPNFEGELELSGVAMASRRAPEVVLIGDRTLRNALPADPTALRAFRAADGVSAYAEVYTQPERDVPEANLGGIRFAAFRAGIAKIDGTVVAQGQIQRLSVAPSDTKVREGFRADFDVSRLAPGRYLLAIETSPQGNRQKTVSRQLPISIQ